jgi:hypothetical protein
LIVLLFSACGPGYDRVGPPAALKEFDRLIAADAFAP